jgi:CHAT domain-containing protein/tetratricopeptide (TPR) repeat protein
MYFRLLWPWDELDVVSLNNLANLYRDMGQYERAEELYKRALLNQEVVPGKKNHPDVAHSLNNLANLYGDMGKHERAEPLYTRALAIREAALGERHPDVAHSLSDLASLHKYLGDHERAESLYERTLSIREAALGKNHPEVGNALNHLAQLRLAQQRLDEALPLFARAFALSEAHLRQEVFSFSEARLANMLHRFRAEEERLYTLARVHPDHPGIRHLALSAALLRKARSVEEIAGTSRTIHHGLGQTDRETFERLRALRTQLSTLSLAGPGPLSPADYQQRLRSLADQGDALEDELARRSAPSRAFHVLPSPAELLDRVAKALPSDGVLIEFVAYRDSPLVPTPGTPPSPSTNQPHYLAFLLFADGRTHAIDLGPTEHIDRAALRLHDVLARRSASYQPATQELYARAIRPLEPLLGKVRRLFIAPDGQLALIPFAALHDGRRFLVDAFDITYLNSGKDILPRTDDIPIIHSVVVLADPDFSSAPVASPVRAPPVLTVRSASLERFFSTLRLNLPDQPWPPLPGTTKEAEAIQRMLPQAQLLLGSSATKDALLNLPTPGLLHIATHGFFLEDAPSPPAARAVKSFGVLAARPPQPPSDPLLRSGLVLAGAHDPAAQPDSPREDYLVTALELASLNLWGTQLVVLSACDTGRGEVKHGQGVYGLRRALTQAGTETLVTSLWKVNDETTHQLMVAYYRNLIAGQGRIAALRKAMRTLRHTQPHPHFWAPFIGIGQDAPLKGLAPRTAAPPAPRREVQP